jgi:hypothetical protein
MIAEIAPESGGESDGDVVVPRQCWAGEQGDRIVGAADKDGRLPAEEAGVMHGDGTGYRGCISARRSLLAMNPSSGLGHIQQGKSRDDGGGLG